MSRKPSPKSSRERRRRAEIGCGVDQELEGRRGTSVARGELRDDGGQIAPGAVAADADARRIGAKRCGVGERPVQGRTRVLDGGRERVLRGQPVIDGQHMRAAVAAQDAADAVVRLEIAVGEPTSVVVDEQRVRAAGLGRGVVARPDPDRAVQIELEIGDAADGCRLAGIQG